MRARSPPPVSFRSLARSLDPALLFARRRRSCIRRGDMKAHGHLISGEDRAEQYARNSNSEFLIVELHFAVADEAAVRGEEPVNRHGHRTRIAVKGEKSIHDCGAFVRPHHHNPDDTIALESDTGKFLGLQRFPGDASIARRAVAAISGRVDDDPYFSGALDVRGIAAYFAVNYSKHPDCIAANHRRVLCNSGANGTTIGIDF